MYDHVIIISIFFHIKPHMINYDYFIAVRPHYVRGLISDIKYVALSKLLFFWQRCHFHNWISETKYCRKYPAKISAKNKLLYNCNNRIIQL